MPTFATPQPILARFELVVGEARIIASDRTDTVVDVQPSDATRSADVTAAAQTRVDYTDGRLTIITPRQRGFLGKPGSIDLRVELPTGSGVRADASVVTFRSQGPLGDCEFTSDVGDIHLEQTAALQLTSHAGNVTVERVVGRCEVKAGSGSVRVDDVDGPATIKNSNGASRVGAVTGDLRVNATNGAITIDRAHRSVGAKTANGSIQVGEVASGSVVLSTAVGGIDVGIRSGTAALVDARSKLGRVDNRLDAVAGPAESDDRVEIKARTALGDIKICRA
ncbi:DUF4097 family beta strand repeat-containing protein [Actinoalloteichus hymeniacidonis]|uniref:DUF4098 family protein n=1 Tax=Actinoalloteichus hymeniacidonis TaxID=340345 RepID=A0AAC9HR89_9PSEU|nr:DUF4097 family beta strand repeat-containing protein [Actinoalloteichus hymeniacidonis]AOS64114.1 putative DUF4098 family protein [Actinoalloteichus hymeniacidonis]MBB5907822.1 hypothetical protein [Actinoalloteichus hymeniacidonis]